MAGTSIRPWRGGLGVIQFTPVDRQNTVERVISTARLLLLVASLVAFWTVPYGSHNYSPLEVALLLAYLAFSLFCFVISRWRAKLPPALAVASAIADVGWASAMGVLTEGPNSSFFLFFTFALLTCAYRWGMARALASGLIMVAIMVAGTIGRNPIMGSDVMQREPLLIRSAYLLILTWIAGFLAEEDRRNRRRAELVNGILTRTQSQPDFPSTLRTVLVEAAALASAEESVLVLRNNRNQKSYLWQYTGSRLRCCELADSTAYLEANRSDRTIALSDGMPGNDSGGAGGRIALDLRMLDGWSGKIFLSHLHEQRPEALELLHTIAQEVTPAVQNVYITRQLHQQAGAAERARLARELHDGILQELAAISFEAEALRRSANGPEMQTGLARIRDLVTTESLRLRQLIEQFRPVEISPKDLPAFLERVIDRFQRETGIAVSLVSTLQEDAAPPRVTREIARITQEALINIRKHSGAKHVVIRLESTSRCWRLEVDDDGSGFDFSGRLALDQLDAMRKGPIVIKERARAIGAEMEVESAPGKGSRIEVRFPRHAQARAGR